MEDYRADNPDFDEATFAHEMSQPITLYDTPSDNNFAFYIVNRQFTGRRPLISYNGLGSTPDTLIGRLHIKSYAKAIQRPIIAPMSTRVSGISERRRFAQGHARALEKVTTEKVDITGTSWGGVLAYSVAEAIQDKANHLITASSVGTRNGLGRYAISTAQFLATESRQARNAVKAAVHDATSHDLLEAPPSLNQLHKLRSTRLLGRRSFHHLSARLNPNTTWHDIIGENDVFSSVSDHLDIIKQRNRLYPGTSRITVVQNHGHLWSHMRSSMAQLINRSLLDSESRMTPQPPEIDYLRARQDLSGLDNQDSASFSKS